MTSKPRKHNVAVFCLPSLLLLAAMVVICGCNGGGLESRE